MAVFHSLTELALRRIAPIPIAKPILFRESMRITQIVAQNEKPIGVELRNVYYRSDLACTHLEQHIVCDHLDSNIDVEAGSSKRYWDA